MAVLTLEHQAREQLNLIGLLGRCLKMRNITTAEARQWTAGVSRALGRLKRLFAKGLDRGALLARIRVEAREHDTTPPASSVNALRR